MYAGLADAIGGKSAILYLATPDFRWNEVLIGYEQECEDCIPTPLIETTFEKYYELRDKFEMGLIGTHEVGHLLGLLHPWDYESGNGFINVDIYTIFNEAIRQLNAGKEDTIEQNQVKNNILNSTKNPVSRLRGTGSDITPGQLKQSVNTIKMKNEENK